MADKRPQSHATSLTSLLFGRRTSNKSSSSKSSLALTSNQVDARKATPSSSVTTSDQFDEDAARLTSPRGGTVPLPGISGPAASGSSAPFQIDQALASMETMEKKSTELVDLVKSTSVHLANVLLDHHGSSPPSLEEMGLDAEGARKLYGYAIDFCSPNSEYALRTAAMRLLAVLLGAMPPREAALDPAPAYLPPTVTKVTLYRLITAPSANSPGSGPTHTNQIFVEVGALKALTRDGQYMDGMDGIAGWLTRTLIDLQPDWVAWCAEPDDSVLDDSRDSPFGPIKSASPATAACEIIALLSSIIQNRLPLFAPNDLSAVVRPILKYLWAGITATISASSTEGATSPQGPSSTHSSVHHSKHGSPISAVRRGAETRRTSSLTVGRVEPFPAKPSKSPSRSPIVRPPKWESPFKAMCALVHMLFETTTINDDLFNRVFELLCFAFGQDDTMLGADLLLVAQELVQTMLGAKSGRRGELALRKALEGRLIITKNEARKNIDVERKVTRGAVVIVRICIQDAAFMARLGTRSFSFSSLASSLVAAESTARYPGNDRIDVWARWNPVDMEILHLVEAHLNALEDGSATGNVDAWTEGEAAAEVLDGLRAVVQANAPDSGRGLLKTGNVPLVSLFSTLVHRVPHAVGKLHARLHTSQSAAQSDPSFYHPKYIELLLDLGPNLDEETGAIIIDYYQRECLCLPFTSEWIKNIWKLLEAFALSNDLPIARERVSHLLYNDVYVYVEDLPESREQLVEQVIVPYFERWLPEETDDELLHDALEVLVRAAVSETMQKDDERRRERANRAQVDVEAEDANTLPTQQMEEEMQSGSFDAIRKLLTKLANEPACKEVFGGEAVTSRLTSPLSPGIEPMTSPPLNPVRGRAPRESGLRSLMRTLSPAREPSPSSSSNVSVAHEDISKEKESRDSKDSEESKKIIPARKGNQHTDCKSVHAVKALIAIFTRLAFTSPQTRVNGQRPIRTPASARCIVVYRDLICLLFPLSETPGITKLPARCPRARLTILQWSMRLRADRQHRILFRGDINRFVAPFASILYRTKETEESVRQAMEQEEQRKRMRSQGPAGGRASTGGADEERGRTARPDQPSTRSRSRSKAAGPMLRTASIDSQQYNPLWCVPETLNFEAPPDNQPSEGLMTYDPYHPSLMVEGAPLVEGVWLPVSEYVRALNGLLRWESNWELVSYVLTFLPQQLGNKHFFHGTRATREVKGLLRVLCEGILETDNRWERRFQTPSFIKRPHINSAAYQSLSILISYRSTFDRGECDALVQSLVAGLEGNALLAKPCLQALTICIHELEGYVAKNMLAILQKTQQILSTPAVAVHILEFLVALGNSSLYRNFTDDQYRLVFAVAIGYIAEHNTRSDQSVDFSGARDAFTLSQHVIGLAYHAIYLWFLTLKIPQRQRHVSELVRGLLHAKSQRAPVDERTEVCFDWLARYTYGNADPKPASSFLNEMVMVQNGDNDTPPRSQSWLLGGAIITITAHARTGWATIQTTRATGQTAVVCKLENVPLLDLGEANADMTSLPATLMANRELVRDVNIDPVADQDVSTQKEPEVPAEKAIDGDVDPARAIALVKPKSDAQEPETYVWSGVTPSQRRKDVVIEPSYLALQLLSSYPNSSAAIPRGRIIPKEPKFDRALRGIEATPVINAQSIAVLYVGPGQTTEREILGNTDGSPLYLDFMAGLGRVIKLKGQMDVFTGKLDRVNDTDGAYAYAWWDDLAQIIFHTVTLVPNLPHDPEFNNKKRLVGNDYVRIVYNESGQDYAFDTLRTQFNFINIVISPYATRDVADGSGGPMGPSGLGGATSPPPGAAPGAGGAGGLDDWGGDSEDFFKVTLQRAPGIPDFSPIGEYKLVSKKNLPSLVRQMAHHAHSMAVRFQHVQNSSNAASAEYITSWRYRLRSIARLRELLPQIAEPGEEGNKEEVLRDFTRIFSPPQPAE